MMEQFNSTAEYYSTAFHELTHSTGHSSRLDRLRATAHFGNESYSKEELVAEIGAAALVNYVGLETPSTLCNSAAYIQSWLTALRNDKRLIVTASGAASRAFAYITGKEAN
jgi:antirestriction protein ArdC